MLSTRPEHGRVGSPRCRSARPAATVSAVPRSVESTAAELGIIADNIGQYRARVAGLADGHVGTERDDLVSAIHEAERQLRIAERTLLRAARAAV